jgi:tRNA threonylcarbamoyladenosine biosynthesis protein TsaE
MRECVTYAESQTRAVAASIGASLLPGDILLLFGELGAGKTTFVQGLARGMGLEDNVTSPTFTLIQEYGPPDNKLVHVDPYRLESETELSGIGFEDYLDRKAALAVEWSERLGSLTPPERLEIHIERLEGDRRRIRLVPVGPRWEALLERAGPC